MIKTWYKRFIGILIAMMLCFTFLPSVKAFADSTYPFVDDGADVFTDEEEKSLSERIAKIQKKYNADVVALTANDRGWDYSTQYVEDYYDANYAAGNLNKNTTILYFDSSDRTFEIQGYGACEDFITSDRGDRIRNAMLDDFAANDFYNAYMVGLNKVSSYYGSNPNPATWTWLHAVIALIIGTIVTITMVAHTKGKITTSSRTYLDQAHSGLTAKRDMYINTTVRKVHIQQSNGGSGGHSGGGMSSGGHSHSTSKGHV